mgnify:CR=1 FL=1
MSDLDKEKVLPLYSNVVRGLKAQGAYAQRDADLVILQRDYVAKERMELLVALVRRIAESNPIADAPGGGEGCIHCWRKPDDHAEDCIWLIAQGARTT